MSFDLVRMASFSGVAFALLFIISGQVARAAPSEGLYVTNGTDILFISDPQSQSASSIYNKGKRITGLAHGSGFIYWSEVDVVERGIYRATTDNNRLTNVTKIVGSEDVMEVNCLTFDWISNHLYWVDERKRTLEVADSDGANRRILVLSGLQRPRCIYADPINGYLFWSDQGLKHIARADLDGSNVKVIVTGLTWPNQLIVHDRKLYWVDASDKTFQSSNLDGGDRTSVSVSSLANKQNIFGLATDGQKAYITNWKNGQILTIDLNGNNPRVGARNLGTEFIFSAIYVKSSLRQQNTDPCSGKGCASLCLPIKAGGARCSCPSFGGKTLNAGDQKTCITPPTAVLVYALADSGFVAYHDPSAHVNGDLYLIGRSLRPVAVAYDSLKKTAYWSDVRERTIHSSKLDGREHRILLGSQQGIGLVEGMVVDVTKRQLFYTNVGEVRLNDVIYSWHKVETFRIDSAIVKVRTLVASAERPRAVALDPTNGHLYYTDWGSRASIVRIDLDGSNPTLIRTGLDNPNGIAILNNKLYLVDSHFKTRQQGRGQYPPPPKNGSLYSMNLDGSGFTDVLRDSSTKLQTPFGIAVSSNTIYVSDWEKKFLVAFDFNGTPRGSSVLDGVPGIMSLTYSSVETTSGSGSDVCSSNTCEDMCLVKNRSEAFCTCNSYSGKSLDTDSKRCTLPSEFLIVADMNSIKLVSLDGRDSNPYTLVQGNPFLSNFAGLAYDPTTKIVYYSDVNRRGIYAVNLVNMSTSSFYRINSVIDGMAVSDGFLYWTDFSNGRISYLSLTTPNSDHKNLVVGLKRPRGIRVTNDRGNRNIYWTEWGDSSHRVAMLELDGNNRLKFNTPKVILRSRDLIWLNGIFLDGQRLYAVDGFSENRRLFNCNKDGSSEESCELLPGINDTLKHAYDIWRVDGKFYYSDWETGAVNAYDPKPPGSVWPVIEGLMRPTQMHIHSTKTPDNCRGNRCNEGTCQNLLGTHRCNCSGKVPTFDLKGCTGPGSTCSNSGKSYSSGQTYSPAPCLQCQCYGVIPYSDPVYNGSICRRMVCPKLNCDEGDILPPADGACCSRCEKCGIKITNCPDKPIPLTLPDNRDFVVNDFLPNVKDCLGYAREVSFTKKPPGSVYRQKTEVTITASSKALGKDLHDHDTCTFTIEVTDKTPPRIKCPSDVIAYLAGEETTRAVRWNPPEVSDNVGIQGNPVANPPWDSPFQAGKHTVSYTVRDKSGLESSCSFTVTVVKLKTTGTGTCQIPNVNNGNLNCSFNTVLTCSLICNGNYQRDQPFDTESLVCQSGTWNKDIRDDFQQTACINLKTKSARGSLKIAAVIEGDCSKWDNLGYTRDSLQSSIQDSGHLQRSGDLMKLAMTVKVTECVKNPNKPDSSIVNAVVRLTGNSKNPRQVRSDIDSALENVEKGLKSEFIRITFLGKSELKTAESVSLTRTPADNACLPGEIQKGSDSCVVCPIGTYQEGDQCQPCTTDFYNNEEGQINCKQCPEGQRSPNASTTIEQCKVEPWSMPSWLIYAILCVVSLILVVVIIAFVCVISRRRSRTRKPYELNHRNGTFDPNMDDETYDKIDDVCKDFDKDETYDKILDNLNSYERLEACGGAINYDTIGKEKLQQDDPKANQSPYGQASPNDYYLDPVVEAAAQRASRAVKGQDSPPEDHYLKPVEESHPTDSRVTSAVSYLKLEEGDTTPPGNAYQVGGVLLKPPPSV